MSKELHCYEYVNRPFERVRGALEADALGVFERATRTATRRADTLVSNLKVSVAGLEVGKNVVVKIKGVRPALAPGHMAPEATELQLEWQAETGAALFPAMHASLYVYPLSANETQLDLRGMYEPPGGVLGTAADRLVGHRIAEAAVHGFLRDVASRLGEDLRSL
jgi:hypothetical protein